MNLVMYAPTPFEIVRKMLEVAQVIPEDVVCDLGSGDGRVLFTAVKEFGVRKAIGYEIKEDMYQDCLQKIQQQNLQDRIRLIKGDLLSADLSLVSFISLYLSIAANEVLRPKLEREAKLGSRIVSYLFPMSEWRATREVELGNYAFGDCRFREMLYLYTVPEAFGKEGLLLQPKNCPTILGLL